MKDGTTKLGWLADAAMAPTIPFIDQHVEDFLSRNEPVDALLPPGHGVEDILVGSKEIGPWLSRRLVGDVLIAGIGTSVAFVPLESLYAKVSGLDPLMDTWACLSLQLNLRFRSGRMPIVPLTQGDADE